MKVAMMAVGKVETTVVQRVAWMDDWWVDVMVDW